MRRSLLVFAAILTLGAGVAAAAGPPPKGTVTIALPGDAGMSFKLGSGVEKAQQYCLTCHSSAYVSMQPILSSAQWTAEVTKMKAVYGADIPDDQVAPIAAYLTTVYGKP